MEEYLVMTLGSFFILYLSNCVCVWGGGGGGGGGVYCLNDCLSVTF